MRIKQPEIIYEDEAIIVCRKEAGVAVQTARAGQADVDKSVKELSCKKEGRTVYRADPSPGSTGGGRDGVCENAAGDSKTVCAGQQSQHGKRISGGDNRVCRSHKKENFGTGCCGMEKQIHPPLLPGELRRQKRLCWTMR